MSERDDAVEALVLAYRDKLQEALRSGGVYNPSHMFRSAIEAGIKLGREQREREELAGNEPEVNEAFEAGLKVGIDRGFSLGQADGEHKAWSAKFKIDELRDALAEANKVMATLYSPEAHEACCHEHFEHGQAAGIKLGEERALDKLILQGMQLPQVQAALADARSDGAREEREAADELLYAVELWFDRNLNTLEETDGANALVASIEEFRARGKADKP